MGMRRTKFHGRFENGGQPCEAPGCLEPGEFRAPSPVGASFDGPGEYRWFCLEHVREFNSGYDWFEGMSSDEIWAAQAPSAGWETETRAFRKDAGTGGMPRWTEFADPLDAIGARAEGIRAKAAHEASRPFGPAGTDMGRFTAREREALGVMGLGSMTDRKQLRSRYSELVRRYHPDRNGGDRSHEGRLQSVVEAYQVLKKADAFG